MKSIPRFLVVPLSAIAATSLLTCPANAKPGKGNGGGHGDHGNGHGKGHEKEDRDSDKPDSADKKSQPDAVGFTENDQAVLRSLFKSGNTTQLPPGLAMNLKRGKPLPPGWQQKLTPGTRLENDLLDSLVEVPSSAIPGLRAVPNTALYYHENKIIRLASATHQILDVFDLK